MTDKQITTIAPLPNEKGRPTMPKPPPIDDVVDKNAPIKPEPEEKKPGTALMSWKERMVQVRAVVKEAEKPSGGFISLRHGRMSINDEPIVGDKVNAVIIGYWNDNEFYDKKFDPKAMAVPVCWAINRPGEDMTPWRQEPREMCEEPQVEEGLGCIDCVMFEWGSDLFGGRGKACKTSKRIFLMDAVDITDPGKIAKASFWTMIPPATSADNFSKVINQLENVLDTAMFGAVVECAVRPHDRFQFMVHWKILEQIKDETLLEALMLKHERVMAKDVNIPKPDAPEEERKTRGAGSDKY